jgi:hypothetical protein
VKAVLTGAAVRRGVLGEAFVSALAPALLKAEQVALQLRVGDGLAVA